MLPFMANSFSKKDVASPSQSLKGFVNSKDSSSTHLVAKNIATQKSDLVVRFGHLGDVVLTTGVLNYYGKRQQRKFDVLTQPAWAPLFLGNAFVNNVIAFPKGLTTREEVAFFRSLSYEYKGQELLDLHGNMRSRMLRFFWQGNISHYNKMGLARRLFLLSKGHMCGSLLRTYNVPQRYAAAFSSGSIPSPLELLPSVILQESEKLWAKKTLFEVYGSQYEGQIIAIHPFASHVPKTWSSAKWKAMVELLDKKGIRWIAVGVGEDLFEGSRQSFINRTSLRETAALLAECKCLLTGDSGPMHLASSVETPVVALFGPTTKEWGFYPAGKSDIILESDAMCRPCSLHGKSTCGKQCLEEITPESVFRSLGC